MKEKTTSFPSEGRLGWVLIEIHWLNNIPVILSASEVSQSLIAKTPNYCDSSANASE